MIPMYRIVESLLHEENGGPAQQDTLPEDDTLQKKVASPAHGDANASPPGKDGIPSEFKSSAKPVNKLLGTSFKKGTPDSQEKGTGSRPSSTISGPEKDSPNKFLK